MMVDSIEIPSNKAVNIQTPQCQHFVVRKKRLCRMTVRPGRQYCGEHEPDPKTEDGKNDNRIPCPNDPKHTCYARKLEKHLAICNARPEKAPPYIVENINNPPVNEPTIKISLNEVSKEKLSELVSKIDRLYEEYVQDNIEVLEEQEIHEVVREDFEAADRTESSRRHLRQVSSLLRVAEGAGLARPQTCYVELGAGKGHLSYYAWKAWGDEGGARGGGSGVLLVDRASLRHKRDNKLRQNDGDAACSVRRVRADLSHVVLRRLVAGFARVVGVAKHLCGAATDMALRCVVSEPRTAGLVLATCCHHRCHAGLLGREWLQEMGIDREEYEIILRLVSWATCGHGRPRQPRAGNQLSTPGNDQSSLENDQSSLENDQSSPEHDHSSHGNDQATSENEQSLTQNNNGSDLLSRNSEQSLHLSGDVQNQTSGRQDVPQPSQERAETGRRAKALLDWCRVRFLRGAGFDARLKQFISPSVSPENLCIVATKEPLHGVSTL